MSFENLGYGRDREIANITEYALCLQDRINYDVRLSPSEAHDALMAAVNELNEFASGEYAGQAVQLKGA